MQGADGREVREAIVAFFGIDLLCRRVENVTTGVKVLPGTRSRGSMSLLLFICCALAHKYFCCANELKLATTILEVRH